MTARSDLGQPLQLVAGDTQATPQDFDLCLLPLEQSHEILNAGARVIETCDRMRDTLTRLQRVLTSGRRG